MSDIAGFRSGSELDNAFATWLPAHSVDILSSGRAVQCLILKTLRWISNRKEVVVPAYTCPTVPLSIARAELVIKLCDVNSQTGNMDLECLEKTITEKTLAVIPVHMNGVPCEMDKIINIAYQRGCLVIEDCAQAAGAVLDGRKVGSFGDFSFFSLGRGKGFTAYGGGILVCQSEKYINLIQEEIDKNISFYPVSEVTTIIKLLCMAVFQHPRLYWIVRALPLGWENEVYSMEFSLGRIARFRKGVALSVLKRLDRVVSQRWEKAEYLRKKLQDIDGIQLFDLPTNSQPSYPWLPLLISNRDEVVHKLKSKGLGADRLFTQSLNQYEYLRDIVPQGSYPKAEYVASHLMTLPTHEYVTQSDMDRIVTLLGEEGS